ncbi:hypothetical protein, variant 3 [Verruconis gallopava]|uniref:Poly(A) polymerase n=1 Tax=Verruconis gallopava TaxID=253628 RepID=A0A0D1YG43_9PEZI|nr:hypothetical protein, variant 2 [Verruconis gallopava]XP_016209611.1 hypothetical protein, variant 3 [Verruconis gallopava]KIV99740.1 hypothetical protein, variant 2 [Verruconis gallopava]KIV99741.1 hypothetical protein, variant 3 [Verruconis gallopava]
MASAQQQWGITPPVSMDLPTEHELKLDEQMREELKRQNNFETADGLDKRKRVLAHFDEIAKMFVKKIAKDKNYPQSVQDNSGGLVTTYGSYRLGVINPGSDIDTLLVAPKHVDREDFLAQFPTILKNNSPKGMVQECVVVSEAFVPIIKIVYDGIDVDLIFVALKQSSVPDGIDLKDNNLLRGLDDTDLRSINGVRVTDEILSVIPQQKAFKTALRAIKLWAQRHAVYSNISGFPGGVAWAMMVARVCQLYPMACGSVIVGKVLDLIARWNWPRPIQLKQYAKGPLEVREWNPALYPGDRRHIMPVITPAYPSMCATNNITPSTKEVIIRELKAGGAIYNDIYHGKKTWKALFEKHTFFTSSYKYYLSVIAMSRCEPAHQVWSGLVHSKVRRLVMAIENADSGVNIAHPFPDGFDRVHKCRTEEEVDSILHGDMRFLTKLTDEEIKARNAAAEALSKNNKDPKTVPEVQGDIRTIYTTTFYIGLELSNTGNKKLDISWPVAEFKTICLDWEELVKETMSVCTVHTRNYDLPADVFSEGEKRPEKPKKKKGTKGAATNGSKTPTPNDVTKKRALDAEGSEMSGAKRVSSVAPTVAG